MPELKLNEKREEKTLFIHQRAYIKRILEKFRMHEAKSLSVPADPNASINVSDESEIVNENLLYCKAIGSLMFLSRPDIAYAVSAASRYINKYNDIHWNAIKRIMRYLVETINYRIMYEKEKKSCLVGYSDSDYVGDCKTRRSTTGYAFVFDNRLITWMSQRQKMVTLSTIETEYVAASAAAREAVWVRSMLELKCDKATVLYVDNQSAIRLAKNPEFHK